MNIDEGAAFGALIIGVGVGFMVWQKTQNMVLATAIGVGLTIADYVFLLLVKKIFKK